MLYLLDTNTASFIIKGNVPGVRRRLARVPMNQAAISSVTEAELRFGVARKPEATRLRTIVERFLALIEILPWDSAAAGAYADLRAALERSGKPISNLDLMIAAHALGVGAVLVSSDRVFRGIEHLRVEDWSKA